MVCHISILNPPPTLRPTNPRWRSSLQWPPTFSCGQWWPPTFSCGQMMTANVFPDTNYFHFSLFHFSPHSQAKEKEVKVVKVVKPPHPRKQVNRAVPELDFNSPLDVFSKFFLPRLRNFAFQKHQHSLGPMPLIVHHRRRCRHPHLVRRALLLPHCGCQYWRPPGSSFFL